MSVKKQNSIRILLGMRNGLSVGAYLCDFLFRKILRQNRGVNWLVHFTSTVHNPKNIVRGINVFPGDSPNVYINAANGIEIGDYTNIGPGVGLLSVNHHFVNNEEYVPAKPIIIGKHCWIGKDANILPEVILGDFTIVGAGSVVTHNFEDGYCVIAGNPARKIKDLTKTECLDFAKGKK